MKALPLFLALLPLMLPAAGWETPERIRAVASEYASAQTAAGDRVELAQLDPRLRLPACGTPLQASSAAAPVRGALTVTVRCAGPSPWNLYVPVRIAQQREVLVAARSLARGAALVEGDLRRQPLDTAALSYGWYDDTAQALGKTLRRPLAAGSVLTPEALESARVVRRGELVTLLGRAGGIEVRAQGKALADGGEGDSITVENGSSRRVVQGVVRGAGVVEVGL